jgi:hypothetical protein
MFTHYQADRLAIKLGRITGSSHVLITIKPRRWWHNLSLQLAWQREWAETYLPS